MYIRAAYVIQIWEHTLLQDAAGQAEYIHVQTCFVAHEIHRFHGRTRCGNGVEVIDERHWINRQSDVDQLRAVTDDRDDVLLTVQVDTPRAQRAGVRLPQSIQGAGERRRFVHCWMRKVLSEI